MSITLTLVADNPRDLQQQLMSLAIGATFNVDRKGDGVGADTMPAGTPAAENPKPSTRSSAKKSEPAKTEEPAGAAETGSTATPVTGEAVTKEQVTKLCNEYGGKAGATALQKIFKELGSPQGKFSGVAEDKYPALAARLTELLNA